MSVLTRTKNYIMERFPLYNRRFLRRQFDKLRRESGRRTPISVGINYVDKVVEIPYNYSLLCMYALFNPVLRLVHDAIIREVVRNGWEIQPRFKRKCPVCGYESQKEEETCPQPQCTGVMREPELEQKRWVEAFFKNPNSSNEMVDITKSILRFALAVDDWYLSITEHPTAIYVEDSRNMRIVADKLGRLGNQQYFCPECLREASEKQDPEIIQSACQIIFEEGQRCPKHPAAELKETCYVYQDGSTIKARFGKDEIIHGQVDSWLPDLYGHSKVVAVLRQIRSVTAMDKWNFDTYTTGKMGQIIVFKDMDQDEVNKIADDIEADLAELKEDMDTGEIKRKMRTLWLSSKEGIDVAESMPPSEKMQSIDWWQLWREVVGAVYGVQPVFMGATEQGKTGYHQRMQILVMNDTTLMYQQMIETPLNETLLPRLNVTDWVFKFNPIEEKNELADVQILQSKIAAATTAANAGMYAELTEEGELKIYGKPEKSPLPQGARSFISDLPKPPKIPVAEQPLETEKSLKKGKQWLVTEVDSEGSSSG